MIRQKIANLVKKSVKELQGAKKLPQFDIPEIKIEHPEGKVYGDYSTNVAMQIAKTVKKNPMEIAEIINDQLLVINERIKLFEKIEVVRPGFINFFLSKEYSQKQVAEILTKGDKFGQLKIGKNQKVNLEFISANPTGPLTLGNGRGGFCGDVLANVLTMAGYKVEREYYINDVGEQVRKLGHSVIDDAEAVYKGDYIKELRKKVKGENPDKVGQKAAKIILKEMIKPSVKKMGIVFDVWFSEKSLHQKGEVAKALSFLKKKGLAYEKDGALWFKSTRFGDDKDRVLIKADGETTYLAADVAYLKNKFKRGSKKLLMFWGADHYGYVARIKAVAQALGLEKDNVELIIMQLVRLFRKGKEVRMSKRAGIYITLDELIDEVGLDAARFFFLTRAANSHLNFDLDLAKKQSAKNPVYYVQYAHARICSILCKKDSRFKIQDLKFKLLNHPSELVLIKQLIRFEEVIEDTTRDYQLQRIPQYAVDLATTFHQFYRDCRVISSDKELTQVRFGLILAVKTVIKNTLSLMGVSSPEKM